jgi:type III secretion protein R
MELIAIVAALAVAPFFLVLVTSFAKIAVVLSLLRYALGIPDIPSSRIITGLAIVLSIFVMTPVARDTYAQVRPWLAEPPDEWTLTVVEDAAAKAAEPLRGFLLRHAHPDELDRMSELATELQGTPVERSDLTVAISGFALSELAEAFAIGVLLLLPFLVIDLVVANALLALGMTSLSPSTVSLPFKLLLFVAVNGWTLVVEGLLLGYV